ncbi:MAG: putative polyphosphate/ATP-dependent NAD kinase [Psychrobacter glaciei]|jgi:predicted polyphosphate/ATP-dependent NAD kinase
MFKLGLIVNPLAGLGGSVALKGSDGVAQQALAKGAVPKANLRTQIALDEIVDLKDQLHIITCPNNMGETIVKQLGFSYDVIELPIRNASHLEETNAEHTKQAAQIIKQMGVDLLVFAGGDGTARDVCAVIEDAFPVLGVPAGVKIHSGVYGITPKASGQVIRMLIEGELVDLKNQDVRDIDEVAFRNNQVKTKLFGEMLVPQAGQFVQAVKQGGMEQEDLVLEDIAAYLADEADPEVLYLVGSGKTTQFYMDYIHADNTLLGVDAVYNGNVVANDLTERQILELTEKYQQVKIIVSVIGGQGHVFGRGNQQLSAAVIKKVGRDNLIILCTKTKLKQLEGRPLIVDTSDVALDLALAGHIEIFTGYNDRVLYPIQ